MLAETVVEFILCSRMKSSVAAPPQGVVLYPLPPTLLVMLDSADIQVVSLSRLLKPAIKPVPVASTMKVRIFFAKLTKIIKALITFRLSLGRKRLI